MHEPTASKFLVEDAPTDGRIGVIEQTEWAAFRYAIVGEGNSGVSSGTELAVLMLTSDNFLAVNDSADTPYRRANT